MRRTPLVVLTAVLCAVLATGCMRTEIGVIVDKGGSGAVQIDAYFPTATLERQGVTEDMLNRIVEGVSTAASAASSNLKVTTIATSDERGIRLSIPFDDYHQVTATMTGRDPSAPMIRVFDTFEIAEVAGGGWSFHGRVDPNGFADTLRTLLEQARGTGMQIPGAELDPAEVGLTMSVTLPGAVTTTNSTDVHGGQARWQLTGDHAATDLTMATDGSSGGIVPVLLGVAALLVVLAGVVVLVARRRRRRRDGATPAGPAGPSGPGWQPPAGAASGAPGWAPAPGAAPLWGAPPPSTPYPEQALLGSAVPGSTPPTGQVPLGGAPSGPPQQPSHPGPWSPQAPEQPPAPPQSPPPAPPQSPPPAPPQPLPQSPPPQSLPPAPPQAPDQAADRGPWGPSDEPEGSA